MTTQTLKPLCLDALEFNLNLFNKDRATVWAKRCEKSNANKDGRNSGLIEGYDKHLKILENAICITENLIASIAKIDFSEFQKLSDEAKNLCPNGNTRTSIVAGKDEIKVAIYFLDDANNLQKFDSPAPRFKKSDIFNTDGHISEEIADETLYLLHKEGVILCM